MVNCVSQGERGFLHGPAVQDGDDFDEFPLNAYAADLVESQPFLHSQLQTTESRLGIEVLRLQAQSLRLTEMTNEIRPLLRQVDSTSQTSLKQSTRLPNSQFYIITFK